MVQNFFHLFFVILGCSSSIANSDPISFATFMKKLLIVTTFARSLTVWSFPSSITTYVALVTQKRFDCWSEVTKP